MAKSATARDTGAFDYLELLGVRAAHLRDLLRLIQRGLPYETIERLQRSSGLDVESIAGLVQIPRRTLSRRRQDGRFLPEESDRLVTVARVIAKVLALFGGDARAACQWLSEPAIAFGGATPLAIASTETGAREVENLAGRIEDGVFW